MPWSPTHIRVWVVLTLSLGASLLSVAAAAQETGGSASEHTPYSKLFAIDSYLQTAQKP
jgi:hypothetical protein